MSGWAWAVPWDPVGSAAYEPLAPRGRAVAQGKESCESARGIRQLSQIGPWSLPSLLWTLFLPLQGRSGSWGVGVVVNVLSDLSSVIPALSLEEEGGTQ